MNIIHSTSVYNIINPSIGTRSIPIRVQLQSFYTTYAQPRRGSRRRKTMCNPMHNNLSTYTKLPSLPKALLPTVRHTFAVSKPFLPFSFNTLLVCNTHNTIQNKPLKINHVITLSFSTSTSKDNARTPTPTPTPTPTTTPITTVSQSDIRYCQDTVRSVTPYHYMIYTSLSHKSQRIACIILHAYYSEILHITHSTHNADIAKLRYAWWKESLHQIIQTARNIGTSPSSAIPRHPILQSLYLLAQQYPYALNEQYLVNIITGIEGYHRNLQPLETMDELYEYADLTLFALLQLQLSVIQASSSSAPNVNTVPSSSPPILDEACKLLSNAGIILHTLKSMSHDMQYENIRLPHEIAKQYRVPVDTFILDIHTAVENKELQEAVKYLANEASNHLSSLRALRSQIPSAYRPLFLTATMHDTWLGVLRKCHYNVFASELQEFSGRTELLLRWRLMWKRQLRSF